MPPKLLSKEEENFRATIQYYDIPYNTLTDHVYGKILKRKKWLSIILSHNEENALEEYIGKIQNYWYLLSIEQVCLKVAKMMQVRVMSFHDRILENNWLKWFKKHHFKFNSPTSMPILALPWLLYLHNVQ